MSDVPNPTVVQDAQQYDWRVDLDSIEACEEVWQCADGCCTNFDVRHMHECIRLAAHIERLEAERDALLAEHEAWDEWGNHSGDALAKEVLLGIAVDAHDNAERVIRG